MRFFGEATGTGEVRALDGAVGIYSGLDYGVFNISMLDGPVGSEPGEMERRLAQCREFFEPRTTRWSFWLCEEFLEPRRLRAAKQALSAQHLRLISEAPGMLAEDLRAPMRALPEIECVPVSDAATREAFGGLTAVSFDIPMDVTRQVYYPASAWQGAYRGYIAKVAGRAVSIVAIVAEAGSLGIYSLATLPEDRRRGYGEALLRAAVAEEQRRTGIRRMILQTTEAGHSLYLKMGFRPVGKFSVYLTK